MSGRSSSETPQETLIWSLKDRDARMVLLGFIAIMSAHAGFYPGILLSIPFFADLGIALYQENKKVKTQTQLDPELPTGAVSNQNR
jgi:hypothetical protein